MLRNIPNRFYPGSPPGPGTVLPPGAFVGQPLVWDGAAWAPGTGIEVNSVTGHAVAFPFQPDVNISAPGTGQALIDGNSGAELRADDNAVIVNPAGDNVSLQVGGTVGFTLRNFGGADNRIRFLDGAAPASVQSITGVSTQDQVDSLVAALVAFGLVTDDR